MPISFILMYHFYKIRNRKSFRGMYSPLIHLNVGVVGAEGSRFLVYVEQINGFGRKILCITVSLSFKRLHISSLNMIREVK